MQQNIWFTPEGLEDLLPDQATKLEFYRRQLLDGFMLSGYELVLPPIAEFTDALLTGTAQHLAVDTCRFTDQESGKMMGVRADMTPQVARIVTNRMNSADKVVRLCYVGEVLKTKNNKAQGSRSPIQIGVELFGHAGIQADLEVMSVMIEAMQTIGIAQLTLSVGHVGLINELIRLANLSSNERIALIDILQRKAVPEFTQFVAGLNLSEALALAFENLIALSGRAPDVLNKAESVLAALSPTLKQHMADLKQVAEFISCISGVTLHFDLSDMRGHQYHTGLIFSCYSIGRKTSMLAKGGRYDGVGSDFGAAHPATGFSMDLRGALDILCDAPKPNEDVIFAPMQADSALLENLKTLKAQQETVVFFYDVSQVPNGARVMQKDAGKWSVITQNS